MKRDLAAFLGALYPTDAGVVELRALPSKTQMFVPVGDVSAVDLFVDSFAARENVYIGVATRRAPGSGSLDNCAELWTAFVDVDFKTTPEAEARARIAHFPLPPHVIVRSGGGLHLYFQLREPWMLPAEADAATVMLRRLAVYFGGDLASAEPVRILRIVGSLNHKPEYESPRLVTLEHADTSVPVNVAELEDWLPPAPANPNIVPGVLPFRVPERIEAGGRNHALYRMGRMLHARGFSLPAIAAALAAENTVRCVPPLPADEVAALAAHVATQSNRLDFAADVDDLVGPAGDVALVAESFAAFCARLADRRQPPDLVPGLLPGLGIAMVHGQPRALKTWVLLEIATALVTGTAAFNVTHFQVTEPHAVWFITDEDPEVIIRDRFAALFAGRGLPASDRLHVSVQKGIVLDDPAWQRQVTAYATDHRIALTIIDPIRASSGAVDQGPRELAPLRTFLRAFMRTSGSSVLLGHHDVKPPATKADDRARPQRASGGGIFSIADTPIHAERLDGDGSQTLLTPSLYKFSAGTSPILVALTADDPAVPTWVRLIGAEHSATSSAGLALEQAIVGYVRAHPSSSGNAIATGLHKNKNAVFAALDALRRGGRLDFYANGQAHLWFVSEVEPQ